VRALRNFEGADDAAAVLKDRPAIERQEIVDQLVEAALADGKLTQNETDVVKKIVHDLGLE
jgi:uncharacterized tellurite resistance protein B-like protein